MKKKIVLLPIGIILLIIISVLIFISFKSSSSIDLTKNKVEGVSDNFAKDMTKYFKIIDADYRNGTNKSGGEDSMFSKQIMVNYTLDKEKRDLLPPNEKQISVYAYCIQGAVENYNKYAKDEDTQDMFKYVYDKNMKEFKEFLKKNKAK